jgi:hypothetical protein
MEISARYDGQLKPEKNQFYAFVIGESTVVIPQGRRERAIYGHFTMTEHSMLNGDLLGGYVFTKGVSGEKEMSEIRRILSALDGAKV